MNEIEQFEYISGKIGYTHKRYPDIKLEIFTQEFMNKFEEYIKTNGSDDKYNQWGLNLYDNLDNPCLYLYNLIKDQNL